MFVDRRLFFAGLIVLLLGFFALVFSPTPPPSAVASWSSDYGVALAAAVGGVGFVALSPIFGTFSDREHESLAPHVQSARSTRDLVPVNRWFFFVGLPIAVAGLVSSYYRWTWYPTPSTFWTLGPLPLLAAFLLMIGSVASARLSPHPPVRAGFPP